MWAASTLASSRSTRMIGAASVLAWVMAVGLLVTMAELAVTRSAVPTQASTFGWLAVVAVGCRSGSCSCTQHFAWARSASLHR
jgi:hypothetical protein